VRLALKCLGHARGVFLAGTDLSASSVLTHYNLWNRGLETCRTTPSTHRFRGARLLHEERKRANLSMVTVAKRGGLSSQMIGYVERGIRMPTLGTSFRITDALGISLPELLKKAGSK
jgi:DNA-binding XRE family transcriptional regulator